MLSFQIKASLMHIGPKWVCQPEIGYTTPRFFKINRPTIRLSLHCSITMVGGHEKQSESNTTSTSSSVSALASAVSADWLIAPSLQNVKVDTQYVGTNEEQKQQIRQLQENWLSSIVSDVEHCQQLQAG
jgi:hypothetical protein